MKHTDNECVSQRSGMFRRKMERSGRLLTPPSNASNTQPDYPETIW
ncbi:hypothetical protein FHS11_002899 [Mucilaginibacter gotjawali]|uniref:Uncharacterized protein n=1 Tax=Mucilaginibacter gotjawali TaxID=1550579 RepID=A0A839SF98_9SPHI|nr:hypothetical protein [Mucilaginibacter gotjawali]